MNSPDIPAAPDYAGAAAGAVYTDLNTYPMRYLTDAAARMGGKVTINGQTYDFTGLGDADYSKTMSDQMAKTLLGIQQNLGPEYIKQALAELQQSDPNGYAARKDLFQRILDQVNNAPQQPLSSDLQDSIVQQLSNAGRLDARQLSQVQQQVRGGQVARGNYLGNAATSQEAGAAVKASNDLRDQQQQQALGYLNSGVTPEDVQYRNIEQGLSNLGAFISGTSPQAQFGSLSSAGNGAAPFLTTGNNTVTTNPNAAQQGIGNALSLYQNEMNWSQQQVNPWTAGLSVGLNTLAVGTNLGWRPFQSPGITGTLPANSYMGDVNVPTYTGGLA